MIPAAVAVSPLIRKSRRVITVRSSFGVNSGLDSTAYQQSASVVAALYCAAVSAPTTPSSWYFCAVLGLGRPEGREVACAAKLSRASHVDDAIHPALVGQ